MSKSNILIAAMPTEVAPELLHHLTTCQLRPVVEGQCSRVLTLVRELDPGLVMVDLDLAGCDSLNLSKRVRLLWGGPLMLWTSQRREVDEVLGLELGADDYVEKQSGMRVMAARIQALLRRTGSQATPTQLRAAEIVLNLSCRTATYQGRSLDLSTAEFDLLKVLVERAGEPLTREQLMRATRGIAYDGFDRSMDLRISHLRSRLGDDPTHPHLIKTVRGVGYLLAAHSDENTRMAG